MKQIIVNGKYGGIALVDDNDYEWVSRLTWHGSEHGYAVNNKAEYKDGKKVTLVRQMHRLILGITDPKILIDHKDRNPLNNQRDNLRKATSSQNGANRRKNKTKVVSKYLGVHKNAAGQWCAECTKDYKYYYKTAYSEVEAAMAYNEMAIQHHGEYANINILTPEEQIIYEEYKKITDEKVEERNKIEQGIKEVYKTCSTCKEYKNGSEFCIKTGRKHGLTSQCKDCIKEYAKSRKKV